MTYTQSIILGVVQGLTEFLPISSSGHLIIVPWLLKFEDPGLSFDVALHFGTLFAILAYFWRDWFEILLGSMRHFKARGFAAIKDHHLDNPDAFKFRLFLFLVVATIPGAVAGLLLEDAAEGILRHPLLVALDISFLGALLWYAERSARHIKPLEKMTMQEAVAVGMSQAVALIPGVSRSGITMTTGLMLGFTRETAARFSFLLAMPITFGACLVKARHFLAGPFDGPLVAGVLSSTLVGFLAIAVLLRYVRTRSFLIFVLYRFAFAALIVAVYFSRG